jgi:hypothetical protein
MLRRGELLVLETLNNRLFILSGSARLSLTFDVGLKLQACESEKWGRIYRKGKEVQLRVQSHSILAPMLCVSYGQVVVDRVAGVEEKAAVDKKRRIRSA